MERASYKTVPTHKLPPGSGFHRPRTGHRVTPDSPAVEVMTDLQRVAAATTGPDASIARANELMIARCVRLLFVVEKGVGLVGLITARDTMGERPITLIRERGGRHGELRVRDLMIPAADIEVLEWEDILRAEVGHIVATLKAHGRQHALVVDTDPHTGDEMVRGIFSATQIGRQLDMPLQPVEIARTFAEIEAELAG
jgi:CBS domain-containing protein